MSATLRALLFLGLSLSSTIPVPANGQAPNSSQESEKVRIERLAALGRLWGVVKFFHPYLAYKEIDWDAALIAAIPKVRAADSAEEYHAAIDGLLSALNDPATHTAVGPVPGAGPDRPAAPPLSRIVDGVLVVNCMKAAERFFDNNFYPADDVVVAYLANNSKGVVFDCRTTGLDADSTLLFGYESALQAAVWTFKGAVTLATYRERQHSGYVPRIGTTTGDYWSGVTTIAARVFEGRRAGDPVPLAFVVDAGTPVMREIVGLRAANLARIVESIDDNAAAPGDAVSYSMPMPGGFAAHVRISELVSPSGELGWRPDISVSTSGDAEAAVTAAIRSLQSPPGPKPDAPAPAALPRTSNDNFYSSMEFPTVEYRLLALFRFWNVVHYFYPYRRLMDRDWDTALAEFLPRFEADQNAFDYEMTVITLAKRMQDSHVNIYNTDAITAHLGTFAPPITVRSIEGETVIAVLRDEAAIKAAGLEIGDAIIAVDGEPIAQRRARLEQFFVASTPQAMRITIDENVLRGAADNPAKLRIKGADGSVREVEIPRSAPLKEVAYLPEHTKPAVYEILPSGYGYIDLGRLQFADADRALDAVLHTPAIIFDMRGYPKGTALAIAPRLVKGDKSVIGTLVRLPARRGSTLREPIDQETAQSLPSSDKPHYAGKVVMLINEQAISQAETTCLAFSAATDVTFIGSPTRGADGDLTNIVLPGTLIVYFSGADIRYGDGRQLQRVGVQPHIRVEPTIMGIRERRDEVLETAAKYLQGRPN